MIEIRLETHGGFCACGKRTWISGQDNSLFERFWDTCHGDGTVELLKTSAKPEITKASVIGISCVEKDPGNRAFDFYIAAEGAQIPGCESYTVPPMHLGNFPQPGKTAKVPFGCGNVHIYPVAATIRLCTRTCTGVGSIPGGRQC